MLASPLDSPKGRSPLPAFAGSLRNKLCKVALSKLPLRHPSRHRRSIFVKAAAGAGAAKEVVFWAEGLEKSHDGQRTLFSDLTFTMSRGERLAVVGENGCGKSTLLKLVSQDETPSEGKTQLRKGIRLSSLSQDMSLDGNLAIVDAVLSGDSPPARAVRRYEKVLAEEDASPEAVQAAISEMEAQDAWGLQEQAVKILEVLNCKSTALVKDLSGGQQRRVGLAAALLSQPDLLVLDEPTNHMDVKIIEWMEQYLTQPDLTVLMVTHDRRFMERLCTRVLELDGGMGYVHAIGGEGSYARMREIQAERRAAQAHEAANARTRLRKETVWMSKQPKARSTKSRARIDQFYELTATAKKKAASDSTVQLSAQMARLGKEVLDLQDVAAKGDPAKPPVFSGFSYEFPPGDRVGIVGPNGAGKSTMLNLLVGKLAPCEGELEVGETTVFGYLTQEPPEVPSDLKLIDYMRVVADAVPLAQQGKHRPTPTLASPA
ncbi:hypothetical protein CYMTET_34450 [Cymbomonas tetramitiformis]|uniref:ABC transporter domain-containing protein n=1 Tax=Cymbomonas tetramitiformis TaxID=36881 RepID=A0AAE0KPY2_9CHLO|nr:hypothetical protein CYMTET_34450 [Cymbomonas tetramitiformis]